MSPCPSCKAHHILRLHRKRQRLLPRSLQRVHSIQVDSRHPPVPCASPLRYPTLLRVSTSRQSSIHPPDLQWSHAPWYSLLRYCLLVFQDVRYLLRSFARSHPPRISPPQISARQGVQCRDASTRGSADTRNRGLTDSVSRRSCFRVILAP